MSAVDRCRCAACEHPSGIANAPGLPHVAYRGVDFASVRRALLRPLPGERALADWRPVAQGDLALQLLEWWAYIADVLAFYNERSLNANMLRTASLDADVRALTRLLGYRPRPGIAASAVVAALLDGSRRVVVPAGTQIEGKPAPGLPPQTFETDAPVVVTSPEVVAASPPGRLATAGERVVHADGKVTSVALGDLLLLVPRAGLAPAVLFVVGGISHRADPAGRNLTELTPANNPVLPDGDAGEYRLLRSARSIGLWKYDLGAAGDLISPQVLLEGVDRTIAAGQPVVLTAPGTALASAFAIVAGTSEQMITIDATATPVVRAPATRLHISAATPIADAAAWNSNHQNVVLLIDWRPVAALRNAPVARWAGSPARLVADGAGAFPVGAAQAVIVEAADGLGVLAAASVLADRPTEITFAALDGMPATGLTTPLRVLHGLLPVTRGKTIASEQVGIGDAAVPFQQFVLQKAPVTYLAESDSYRSTLALYVNGVQWTEVASFYAQPPDAQVFVTFEDDEQKTHLRCGDGTNGALFPTGAAIVASYRVESGLRAPDSGALTTLVRPLPGVRAIRAPLPPGGGADPDSPDRVRHYGPGSVLTFGRAIAADDYETIAGTAPSVARVRAYYAWHALDQRATVTLYVGDTAAALTAVRGALAVAADPNRPVTILPATAVTLTVTLGLRVLPGRLVDDVVAAVRHALADPDVGLLGERRTRIGDGLFFSELYDACVLVPGVRSLSGAMVVLSRPDPRTSSTLGRPPRLSVASGEFLVLRPQDLFVLPEVATGV
jgi:hypothetical protein